jgi:hypothetical protein
MWKYRFLNLCFVILLITLVALQHSISVFGPNAHGAGHSRDYDSTDYPSTDIFAPRQLKRAAAFLHDSWHRAMIFRQWLMEYNASQWEIFNASKPIETDLLDARFHVANAEVFGEAIRDDDRAVKELARAEVALDAIRIPATSTLGAQLKAVKAEILTAEIEKEAGSVFATATLEAIKTELDHLIERIHRSEV